MKQFMAHKLIADSGKINSKEQTEHLSFTCRTRDE